VILADGPEVLGLDRRRGGLHRGQQARDGGLIDGAILHQGGQRLAGQAGGFQHGLLLGGAGQPLEDHHQFPHQARRAAVILIVGDQSGHQAPQGVGGVPVGRGRFAGLPFRPIGRGGAVLEIDAEHRPGQRQVRVQRREPLQHL
jgi:hypothetical protein